MSIQRGLNLCKDLLQTHHIESTFQILNGRVYLLLGPYQQGHLLGHTKTENEIRYWEPVIPRLSSVLLREIGGKLFFIR